MIWATKALEMTKDVNNLPVAYVSQMKEKFVSRAGLEPASPQYYSGVIDRTRPIQGTSFFRDICVFYGSSPTLLTSISCHISAVVTRCCSGCHARLVTRVRILLATRIFLLFERRMSKATGELCASFFQRENTFLKFLWRGMDGANETDNQTTEWKTDLPPSWKRTLSRTADQLRTNQKSVNQSRTGLLTDLQTKLITDRHESRWLMLQGLTSQWLNLLSNSKYVMTEIVLNM